MNRKARIVGLLALLLLLASCTSSGRATKGAPPTGSAPSPTQAHHAKASPQIVFGADSPACLNSPIYVVATDGAGYHQIGVGSSPTWSPDGSRLLYIANPGGLSTNLTTPCNSAGPLSRGSLVVTDPSGHVLHVVARAAQDSVPPAWEPTGGWIIYTYGETLHVVYPDGTENHAIRRMSIAATTIPLVMRHVPSYGGTNAGWTPDGGVYVLLAWNASFWNLALTLDPVTGAVGSRLGPLRTRIGGLAWSPDGSAVDVTLCSHRECDVVTDGFPGRPQPLVPKGDWFGDPSFSPDGLRVALMSKTRGLYVVNSDLADLHRIRGTDNVAWAAWSPDGREILVVQVNKSRSASRVGVVDTVTWSTAWLTPMLPTGGIAPTAYWQPTRPR